jgi:hypothetical protein
MLVLHAHAHVRARNHAHAHALPLLSHAASLLLSSPQVVIRRPVGQIRHHALAREGRRPAELSSFLCRHTFLMALLVETYEALTEDRHEQWIVGEERDLIVQHS